ncbi:MAG: hypothetical protein J6E46_02860 [Faecalicoccus sp.]|nr:hypothetical protein [Faecalicoccus sp.]
MSILSTLFNSLTKEDDAVSERPCSNCPSDCAIAGDACSICEPYKRKLLDQIYWIEHLDQYYDQYEVTGIANQATVNCPYCGGVSTNPYVCDYCGSKLSENTGKIRVEKASDIPNPITMAQDIIFERADAVLKNASGTENSLIDSLMSFINGESYTDTQNPLGAKMSESEIKEAASLYGVSIADYLIGLDNGKYLTLAAKKAEAASSTTEYTCIPGVAGLGMWAGAMLGDNGFGYRPRPKDPRHDGRPPKNMRPPNRDQFHERDADHHSQSHHLHSRDDHSRAQGGPKRR